MPDYCDECGAECDALELCYDCDDELCCGCSETELNDYRCHRCVAAYLLEAT